MGQCSHRSHDTLENKHRQVKTKESLAPRISNSKHKDPRIVTSSTSHAVSSLPSNALSRSFTLSTGGQKTEGQMSPGAVLPVVHSLAADSTSPETDA